MTIILAAVLSLNLNVPVFNSTPTKAPTPVCHITTTSHKFVGAPGTTFRYDGDSFTVPARGWIELVATKATSYEVNGRDLPLNVFPRDQFGTETVQLPTAN